MSPTMTKTLSARAAFRALRIAAKKSPHGTAHAEIAGRRCWACCHLYGTPSISYQATQGRALGALRGNIASHIDLAGEARTGLARGHSRGSAIDSFRFWIGRSREDRSEALRLAM